MELERTCPCEVFNATRNPSYTPPARLNTERRAHNHACPTLELADAVLDDELGVEHNLVGTPKLAGI